jgi:hypothetical protein
LGELKHATLSGVGGWLGQRRECSGDVDGGDSGGGLDDRRDELR